MFCVTYVTNKQTKQKKPNTKKMFHKRAAPIEIITLISRFVSDLDVNEFVVAFYGCSGSGKTSLIQGLQKIRKDGKYNVQHQGFHSAITPESFEMCISNSFNGLLYSFVLRFQNFFFLGMSAVVFFWYKKNALRNFAIYNVCSY